MISLTKQGGNTHQQAVPRPRTDRVVPKPVPEAQSKDPRGYQLGQLRKRYSPRESTAADGTTTTLVFRIKPSDPDFPFELEHLECELAVPGDYPDAVPVLRVRNSDIPRGFGINIERGWDRLVRERQGATLLSLTYALDKNLESFLSEQEVATVKLVNFNKDAKDTRHLGPSTSSAAIAVAAGASSSAPSPAAQTARAPSPAPAVRHYTPEEYFTKEEMAAAKARRAQETRQLETRMGRLSLYRRSPDGIVYTLPLEPRRHAELPSGLQGVKTVHLIVPLLYPLQPLRIQLNECDSQAAEPLEEFYVQKAAEQKQMTLTSHLNYLAQNMHVLAKQALAPPKRDVQAANPAPVPETDAKEKAKAAATADDDRSHIKFIPRPPEWGRARGTEGGDTSDDDDSSSSGGLNTEDDSDEGGGAGLDVEPPGLASGLTPERGTAISFPTIELHSIELFQVSILNLSVKCSRCKTINEITGLRHEVPQTASCRKCAAGFAAQFRQQLVHANSTRAGFVDLTGCTVADMLPSTFVPVCAKCSTPSQGLVSVRGDATTNVCRTCHGRFTFKIPAVKFLAISAGGLAAPTTGPVKKAEKLGLHAGTPLPDRGACGHYKKSYRWFRFSCCARVHPCDRCHDEAENHVNEWANRMVCGWCSREQRYSPEACGFCGRSVIGRKGKGFWEGGKGTRDRKLMSRKDPRKFKRVGGGEASKKKD